MHGQMSGERNSAQSESNSGTGKRSMLLCLKMAVSLLFVMLAAQVVFAAGFLGGDGLMFARHRANARYLTVVAFVVCAMAMLS